jgi:hypothetical protein
MELTSSPPGDRKTAGVGDPFFFRCIDTACASEFQIGEKLYQCPKCSDLLDVCYHFPQMDVGQLKKDFRSRRLTNEPLDISGVWRYRELLPFRGDESAPAMWGSVTCGSSTSAGIPPARSRTTA